MDISGNSKQRAMDDKLINLPMDVLNCILDHLPIRDAARTSILSRKWRYIWAGHPKLVLDPKNIVTVTKNDFVGICNEILLQHIGPILTFHVYLSDVHMSQYPNIDRWILYLSRNGLRKLKIKNSWGRVYALPSYIFLCQELTELELSNCIFKQPCGTIRSFQNLKVLFLIQVAFKPEVSASIFTASKLETLCFIKCIGMDHLKFDGCSPSLSFLVLYKNHGVTLSCFMNCKRITTAKLVLPMEVKSLLGPGKRINLASLFEHWPLISSLFLDAYHLKLLAADSITSALPVKVNHLRVLKLSGINFTNEVQISSILCLLHSSPRVHSLEIWMNVPTTIVDNNPVLKYLQDRSCMSEEINSLRDLKMRYFQGSRAEMLFVKLILVCCPALERVTFEDWEVKPSEVSNILKELVVFPRASRKAQIIF
ncbi:F-box/FBD/LRR-repeat protein At1g13570-like isoform X1 [Ipomoea triloba]|uniref:F-box/FBD/LRR-repeat protein At1g13570-like isoform X1 n=1 Tax=Ipomoea triloba TaxID=35885 RepID=UPI00125DFED1|nr:F-box/FBD/LRR-repeat protein At1g13570-like isoform X1 [Ipomoea triloba]